MFIAESQHGEIQYLVGPMSVRQLTYDAYRNLKDCGVPVADTFIKDETVRLIADTTTAKGGVAAPGPDNHPQDYRR